MQAQFETRHYKQMVGLSHLIPNFGDAGGPELGHSRKREDNGKSVIGWDKQGGTRPVRCQAVGKSRDSSFLLGGQKVTRQLQVLFIFRFRNDVRCSSTSKRYS